MRETPLIATGMSQYATYKLHSSRPGDFRRHELAEIPFESAVDARQMIHRNRACRSKRTCMAVFPNELINSFGNTKRPTGIEDADRHLIALSEGISAIFRVRFPETGHLRHKFAKTTRGLCAQDTEQGRARRVDLSSRQTRRPVSERFIRIVRKQASEPPRARATVVRRRTNLYPFLQDPPAIPSDRPSRALPARQNSRNN